MFLEEGQYFMGEDEMRLARDWEKLIGGNVSVDIHVISWMDEDEFGRNDIFKYSLVIDSK